MERLGDAREVRKLELSQGPLLGELIRADPSRLEVEFADLAASRLVTVADLVALPVGDGFLIGLIHAVLRQVRSELDGGSAQGSLLGIQIMPLGTLYSRAGPAGDTFRRGASTFPHLGASCHLIEGDQLHEFMSLVAEEVADDERLVLGYYVVDREAPAVANANKLFQRHVSVLGSTGAGKSWAVASIVSSASRLSHANVIVFDLHGEYQPLTERTNDHSPVARGLRIAGPADLGRASEELLYLPYWMLDRDEILTLVLNRSDPYASDQILRFSEHAYTLKEISLVEAGMEAVVPTFSIDSPISYRLGSLLAKLKHDNEEKIPRHPANIVDPGPFFGRLTGFISRIEARINDPRYGFIFTPPDDTLRYGWLAETAGRLLAAGPSTTGIKVIDMSEVPSAVLPLVVGVLARLVFDVQLWMEPERRTPVCLVCDEAHLYLPDGSEISPVHRVAVDAFEAIAKEGRKYGVGLLVVSQRPTDVSRTVLSQCNNFIVMRLTNDHDRAIVERLVPETLAGVTGMLPALDVGEAIVFGDALLMPTRIKFAPPAAQPSSATRAYWSLWSRHPSDQEAIVAGVEALRSKLRPRPL
jgi:uncharacterized protein